MSDQDRGLLRMGLLCDLIGKSPIKLGRTALMKLAYLLQIVKGVPLGYDFRLYTYGPFDGDVLNDLGTAEALALVKSEMISFSNGMGYGYEFSRGPFFDRVHDRTKDHISAYESEVRWALNEFGQLSASDLELVTAIFMLTKK